MFEALQQATVAAPSVVKHFYDDSGYWQGAVALLALVLTQLPPVRLWFRQARLAIDVPDRVVITHAVGKLSGPDA